MRAEIAHRLRLTLALGIVLTTVSCDQGTKAWARRTLEPGLTQNVLHGHVQLTLAENRGAFLSLGEALPPRVRLVMFTGVAGLGLIAAAGWLIMRPRRSRAELLGVALLVGGGVGNLIDRLARDGAVTDFLILRYGALRTGVFNVADICITTAAVVILIASIRSDTLEKPGLSQ